MSTKTVAPVQGVFCHLIYSPKGGIEGALIDVDGKPLQLVFDQHDTAATVAFQAVEAGQVLRVQAEPSGPSPKGEGDHRVHVFGRLLTVDGHVPGEPDSPADGAAYQGRVVRFNHARHGEANGVVLDSGDFIHTKPDGMKRLKLKVGDVVHADGDAHRLVDDRGWAVEATTVNGTTVKPH